MTWKFERIAGPCKGITGGIAWDGNSVLFSAVQEERILKFDPQTGKVDNFRKYTGRTNGIAINSDGTIYGAQEGGRRVIHFKADGSTAQTCDLLDGCHHNQPTDVVVDRSGRVWFTDPHNAVAPYGPPVYPFLEQGSVLRLQRDAKNAWNLQRITRDTREPRALALSADEKILYVAEGNAERGGQCELRAYPVQADENTGSAKVLHTFGTEERGIEGLCLDSGGNIVACGGWNKSGAGPLVYVFTAAGAVLESHPAPCDLPMRCAFGDGDLGSLYLTGGDGCLYRAQAIGRRGVSRT